MKFSKYILILLTVYSTSVLAQEPFAVINVINATNCHVNGSNHRIGFGTYIQAISGPNNEMSVFDVGQQGKVALFENDTELVAVIDYYEAADNFLVKYNPGKKKYIVTLDNTRCGAGIFDHCVTFSSNNPCA